MLFRSSDGPGSDALPYLTFVGAPPLRFQRVTPPPDVVTRPAAGAPPVPALTPTELSVALANAAAARSTTTAAQTRDDAPASESKLDPKSPVPARAKAAPSAIIPDDTRPPVRPEDFLPYFQIPGSAKQASEVNVIVPVSTRTTAAPAPLPPSSATYTQSPK